MGAPSTTHCRTPRSTAAHSQESTRVSCPESLEILGCGSHRGGGLFTEDGNGKRVVQNFRIVQKVMHGAAHRHSESGSAGYVIVHRDGKLSVRALSVAEWRNWQTHQTQNLAFFTERVGSTPTSATNRTTKKNIARFSCCPFWGSLSRHSRRCTHRRDSEPTFRDKSAGESTLLKLHKVLRISSNSSSVRGQSSRSRRLKARSASSFPPVWHTAQ